ncbi:hypothetical protein GE061_013611 [Apolygus lucorum]|uniref:DUF4766 domain-containing protein n=1 Tax=Apolygus lucorum TaxID=248454 RepID=A0A8S9XSC7_APOLU|nr:hypothetical protein GE061_013611 [Apolygus lucorum]
MRGFALCLVATLAVVAAEPPVGGGYSYSRPSGGGGYSSGGGGYSSGGGGYSSGGGGYSSGGGGSLVAVAPGPSTNEGQYVDGQILEQVRQIILKDEASSSSGYSSGGGGGFGGYPSGPSSSYGAPSSSYGAPSSSYGVPSQQQYISRVVGVDLEGVKQALQVAQFEQQQSGGGGGGYNYAPSSSYSAPSSSYGAPSRPSGSYGAPF